MKGIIFVEFLEMTESRYGLEVADQLITHASPKSEGAYTTVGTYDVQELVGLVVELSRITGTEVPDILEGFGQHVFQVFVKSFPKFFQPVTDARSFLEKIEGYIHPEVLKIYPEAELPKFATRREGEAFIMVYHSKRKLGHFAKGLINGCLDHFKEKSRVEMKLLEDDGSVVEFTLLPGI